MFTIFHFGFEIFKIAVQAALYSSVLLLLKLIVVKVAEHSKLRQIKFKHIYLTIAGLLFIFSFTYYGNHGLGDESSIPLGYWKSMSASDGYAYFELKPGKKIPVDNFAIHNNHLCFSSKNEYYDYKLDSDKGEQYNSKDAYEKYALLNHLPSANEFKSFYSQYDSYWNGWRFWLLP